MRSRKRLVAELESAAFRWDAEAERRRRRSSDNVGRYEGTADGYRNAARLIRNDAWWRS